MNEFLAEMYGTREVIGAAPARSSDVEKLAEAQLLDEALRAEGYDVDQLPADAIVKVAYELFGDDSALVKAAAEGEESKEEKEEEGEKESEGHEGEETEAEEKKEEAKEASAETFEEKLAQADLLGRAMAHSFIQEQDNIMKEAGPRDWAKGVAGTFKQMRGLPEAGAAGPARAGKLRAAWETAKAHGPVAKVKSMKESFQKGRAAAGGAEGWEIQKATGRFGGTKRLVKEHPKTIAGLAAGGAAYGAHAAFGGKKKAASALDALAERRAMEILKEAGVIQETEESKLAEAVEQRAFELLVENGYGE